MKKVIETTKKQYAKETQLNYSNIAEMPLDEIQFTIEDDVFFILYYLLLMEIRGKTISYSAYKKQQNVDKKNKLLEEIPVLENIDNINYELLDEKRKELYAVRKVKMEGVKVRSKAKWINDGEKVTKYFCNMENRN